MSAALRIMNPINFVALCSANPELDAAVTTLVEKVNALATIISRKPPTQNYSHIGTSLNDLRDVVLLRQRSIEIPYESGKNYPALVDEKKQLRMLLALRDFVFSAINYYHFSPDECTIESIRAGKPILESPKLKDEDEGPLPLEYLCDNTLNIIAERCHHLSREVYSCEEAALEDALKRRNRELIQLFTVGTELVDRISANTPTWICLRARLPPS